MEIQTVGVAGPGLLGRGIAACLLGHVELPETLQQLIDHAARGRAAVSLPEMRRGRVAVQKDRSPSPSGEFLCKLLRIVGIRFRLDFRHVVRGHRRAGGVGHQRGQAILLFALVLVEVDLIHLRVVDVVAE